MNEEKIIDTNVEENNEVVEDTTEGMRPEDYTVIKDMLNEMDSWNKMLKQETHSILKNTYGMTPFVMVGIIPFDDLRIESMTMEDITKFINEHKDPSSNVNYTVETVEDGKKMMRELKDLQMNLYSAEQEASKLKAQSQDILNEYYEYLSSPEVKEARRNRITRMRELADAETDPVKKSNMYKMINAMEQSDTFEFFFTRLQKDVEKESNSIIEQFFDESRGKYVIERYKKKVAKFGFDDKLYKYFFNLEETFLDEKYHAFNNLFLFNYMRYIAYADPYNKTDKLYVQSITSAIANMIYHKFDSKMEEQSFIRVIERFLDYFMDKHDYFMENNTTRPGHPVREVASAKYEADQKNRIIAKMNELNITGYDENASSKELYEYFNTKMEEMLEAQKKERDEKAAKAKAKTSENEDGSVTVEPEIQTMFTTGTTVTPVDSEFETVTE